MIIDNLFKQAVELTKLTPDSRFHSWIKFIDRVDTKQINGYAFVGRFIGGTIETPDNKTRLVLLKVDAGSMKYHYGKYRVLRLNPDSSLEDTGIATDDNTAGWALRIRDQVAALLVEIQNQPIQIDNPLAVFSDEQIAAEFKRRGLA